MWSARSRLQGVLSSRQTRSSPPPEPRRLVANRISSSTLGTVCSLKPISSELTSRAREVLDKQALWLNHYNRYAFTIEGHADERGTREYNIALGARRAQTVREYLVSRGVSNERMRTISMERTASCGMQRQFLLVSEPPGRDCA